MMSQTCHITSQQETTILVHGLWMHGFMLAVLATMLRARGFPARTLSYNFLGRSPAENAQTLHRKLKALDTDRINLVGHSLGGIVILHFLQQYPENNINRIVLIGSPVQGCDVARRIYRNRLLRPFLGRSVENGLLGDVPHFSGKQALGIIAGTSKLSLTAPFYPCQDSSNDGVVCESETHLDHASDQVTIHKSHSGMIFSKQCADLVASFLATGSFQSVLPSRNPESPGNKLFNQWAGKRSS